MRNTLLTFAMLFAFVWSASAIHASNPNMVKANQSSELKDIIKGMDIDEILALSPKNYREKTGKRLGVKNTIKLKVAQKLLKKTKKGNAGVDIPKGVYILGAFFGFAWLLMGLMDDFEGNNWWINLILYFLFWLPGFIHALIKMSDYY
ncbi:MAG: YqaE/Pmp3 family membrane protein [Bacteroidota bacterium]